MKKYYNPVKVVFGIDSLKQISTYAERLQTSNTILIVTGKKAMKSQGIINQIQIMLKTRKTKILVYDQVDSNPTVENIDNALNYVRDKSIGLIIGIGGGSVLDSAKCMAILGNVDGSIMEYLNKERNISTEGIPLIEIPSTAGTGSEVTMWATIWDMKSDIKKKYSLSDERMYAKVAIVDPALTLSLSPYFTAISGLDALSQAIEAYWSKNHNPISDKHALKAIGLIFNYLLKCYKNPKNIALREKLSLGSLESGLAFSNTKTTAVHSISYPITSYFGVPHGLACALTLGSFMEYNSIICEDNTMENYERILDIAKILQTESATEAKEVLKNLMISMDLPTRLSELNIFESDIELIIKEAFTKGRIENNPRKVTKENLKSLLYTLI